MRSILLLSVLILAACEPTGTSTTKPVEKKPVPIVPCQAANYQSLIGQHKRDVRGAKIPGIVRIVTPTTAVTLDYNPNRLNILTSDKGTILKVTCG